MSKNAKIGCEILENEENINIYNTNIYKIQKAIFSSFYNISQPNFANFTNFKMLFLGVVLDFVLLA
jgi:hypothetical protein